MAAIYRNQLILAAGCLGIGFFWGSSPLMFSIFLGFTISISNFWMLERIYRQILSTGRNKGILFASILGKYALLIGVLGGSILYFDLHLVGLLIGLSTLVGAIVMRGVGMSGSIF